MYFLFYSEINDKNNFQSILWTCNKVRISNNDSYVMTVIIVKSFILLALWCIKNAFINKPYEVCNMVLPKFIYWKMPSVMVLGGGAFGRYSGHELEPSWMELVFLYKRPYRDPSPISPCEDTEKRWCLWARKLALTRMWPCWILDLRFPSF